MLKAFNLMAYSLSAEASEDFRRIYLTGIRDFGVDQSEDYIEGLEKVLEFLADFPRAARERMEIVPPVRAHPYKSHLIVYEIVADDVLIIRIRSGREDWSAALW